MLYQKESPSFKPTQQQAEDRAAPHTIWKGEKMKRRYIIAALFLLIQPVQALGFGSGVETCTPPVEPVSLTNPTVVSEYTQSALQTALDSGGQITFATTTPVTIAISTDLQLSTSSDTVLDGKGLVTLDGQGITRILKKEWHDPAHTVSITLQNIRLINGKAPSGGSTGEHSGGAVNVGHPGTSLYIINSSFGDNATTDINTADNQGGAVFVGNSHETVITGSTFSNNQAGNGGAFGGIATGLFVVNSVFTGNSAVDGSTGGVVKGHGGAIHLDGVTNSYNPDSNKAVHVCGSVFTNNSAVRGGGALKVTVSDNKGIKATYEKSQFVQNSASGASEIEGHGGAIYHIEDDHDGGDDEVNVEILECTFSENTGWKQGGGVWLYALGKIKVSNSTFVENQTSHGSSGMGGGLALALGETTVSNCTFANNYAWFHGGGIQASNGANVSLLNTLFDHNESERVWACYQMNRAADQDQGGNLQYPQGRFNQSGIPDDCLVTPSSIVADPQLLALADNGGPTMTMALAQGSRAINAGSQTGAPALDQRGYSRDDQVDIGAYEYGAQSDGSPYIVMILKMLLL